MANRTLGLFLQHLRRVVRLPEGAAPSDGQLLERFAAHRDEAAFGALIQRHGPMVWGVCSRVLADANDIDDAFQATFLVLVRKARSIAKRESVGSWLHGVAHRVALRAKTRARQRRDHESAGAVTMPQIDAGPDLLWPEVRQVLDEELDRLPEKYRAPLVLCYLEGRTNDEAADQLGWTRGTIAGRLHRARELLRDRLARRGVGIATGVLVSTLAEQAAPAAVPVALTRTTLEAALTYAAGPATATSSPAVALAEGVLRTMWHNKRKTITALVLILGIAGAGAGLWLHAAMAKPPESGAKEGAVDQIVLANDPVQAKGDRPALVQGNTAFALDIYGRLAEKKGNLFCSPYSISTALAMTYAGARGQTAEQMAKTLHFNLEQGRLHPAAGALARDLTGNGKDRKYQLNVANSLWMQKGEGFRLDFLALVQGSYGAGLNEVDFVNATEASRRAINAWVEKETRDKIKDLLKQGAVDPSTRLVLTNAIYFKGEWAKKFRKGSTADQPFRISETEKVQAPLMFQMGEFEHYDGGDFQLLELPYAGYEVSMLVLLPKKVDGLADLEKRLKPEQLAGWIKNMQTTTVRVTLPRFKLSGQFELKETLGDMGMPSAFSRTADFSGMTGQRDLQISKVVHKTFVDVTEDGTEAAGATAVVIEKSSAPPKPVEFRADHPFIFLLRDDRSGSILFLGRLVQPEK
jgi:serpin B